MTNEELSKKIIEFVGGSKNITLAQNCMTRVRVDVKDDSKINNDGLKSTDGVLGLVPGENNIQIVLGPGKAKKVSDIMNAQLKDRADHGEAKEADAQIGNWEENKNTQKKKHKDNAVKRFLKLIGEIFIPMIPALIAAGLFNGIGSLISTAIKAGSLPAQGFWPVAQILLTIIGGSFISYLAIFTGVNAAKQFGATPALGGMIGAMSIMTQIADMSKLLGLFNADQPLNSILNTGKGGIIGVIFGVWLLSVIEKWLHKHVPDILDLVVTPIVTMLIMGTVFILIVMPVTGFVSDWIIFGLNFIIDSTNPIIQVISGYVLAAIFLPLVMLGLHQGLIPIYTVQLQAVGYITLFPVLAMAGAGQVGAAISLYFKAKRVGNQKIKKIIAGALPAGFLGVGEPLIYGVTLPLGKPFITAGLGAGFGGAFCMLMHVASTAFGPSGLVAIPIMLPESMLYFFIGLIISYIASFIITHIFIREDDLRKV